MLKKNCEKGYVKAMKKNKKNKKKTKKKKKIAYT